MPRPEEEPEFPLGSASVLLMIRVQESRADPDRCRDNVVGVLRLETGPHAEDMRAPGIPFLHSEVGLSRDLAARALEKHCRFCGACEWAFK